MTRVVGRAWLERLWRYGAAGVAAGAALVIALLAYQIGEALPAQLFLVAVMLSASLGGVGPALLATGIGAAALDYFFEEPQGSWAIESASTLARQVMFVVVGLLIGFLSGRLRATTRQLEEANAQLRRAALVDGLTGLPNRRALNEFLDREWRRAARSAAPLSALMVDVDHFKALNDRLGHAAGDECLVRVGRAIAAEASRPGDFAARYGGEEFTVILGATDAAGAAAVGERIRRSVERLDCAVTVSVGAATAVPAPSARPEALLAEADMALYRAKATGRNRVVVSDHEASMARTGGSEETLV